LLFFLKEFADGEEMNEIDIILRDLILQISCKKDIPQKEKGTRKRLVKFF